MLLQETYKEHYEKMDEIRIKVNELSTLINDLGELDTTGIKNIDNLHLALYLAHKDTIDVFIVEEEENIDNSI